jgi:hypothetical protein
MHYDNSWFFKRFKLINKFFFTTFPGHVYLLLVNLTEVTYLIICQIEHLIKLEEKKNHLGQNDQWLLINWDI